MEVIYKTEATIQALKTALYALESYNSDLKREIDNNPELRDTRSAIICRAGVQSNEEAIVLIKRMINQNV